MANNILDHLTLPNGDTNEFKDNTGTVSTHQHYDSDLVPQIHKVYESTSYYATTTGSWETSSWYFMSIRPDDWYKPWRVKFKVHTYCPNYPTYHSYTWTTLTGQSNAIGYANWNERYTSAHYYLPWYRLKKAGYDAGYGHAIGVSIMYGGGYTSSAYYRTFEIDYYECENCTVTFLDTPVKWSGWTGGNTTNYEDITYGDAITRGLQETGDSNTVTENRINYFAEKTGDKGIWANSLFMEDGSGTYQNICTASDGTVTADNRTTATTKIANTNGFKVGGKIYYTTTSYLANTNISGSAVVYSSVTNFDTRYSMNTTLTANNLTPYQPIYLVGTIHSDGLYYLDSTWWTQTPNDTSKIYVMIGGCYDSTTSNCRALLQDFNPWYYYDGTRLVRYIGDAQTINGHTVAKNVPSDAVFTDTTYSSLAAASGGTDLSLVTTGEKYSWNAKSGSDVNVEQTATDTASGSTLYPLLFSASTSTSTTTEGARKTQYLTYDPYYKKICLNDEFYGTSTGGLCSTMYAGDVGIKYYQTENDGETPLYEFGANFGIWGSGSSAYSTAEIGAADGSWMTISNQDAVLHNNTWDGTNTSLKTTIGAVKTTADGALPLSGGTMTGTIVMPADDNLGIEPATNNYGHIGSSTKKFYKMYASTFYGNLYGDIKQSATSTSTNSDFPILFSNSTSANIATTGINRQSKLTYNPSTSTITLGTISTNEGVTKVMPTSLQLGVMTSNSTYTPTINIGYAGDIRFYKDGASSIRFTGTNTTTDMIKFLDNTTDNSGNGIGIGYGGGCTLIAGGEAMSEMISNISPQTERVWIGCDGDVNILTNLQNGWVNRNDFQFTGAGNFWMPASGNAYFMGGSLFMKGGTTSSDADVITLDPTTGVTTIKKNGGGYKVTSENGTYNLLLHMASSYNRGLYDQSTSKWLIYCDSNGKITIGGPLYTPIYSSTSVSVTPLKNKMSFYRTGMVVYFTISSDFTSTGLASRTTVNAGTIPNGYRPIAQYESGLMGSNNQIQMQLLTNGTISMYNFTTSVMNSGWFRFSGCYITQDTSP